MRYVTGTKIIISGVRFEMKVLVTGAGGYIGRHVVDSLLKCKDTEVIAADIFTDGINQIPSIGEKGFYLSKREHKKYRDSIWVYYDK